MSNFNNQLSSDTSSIQNQKSINRYFVACIGLFIHAWLAWTSSGLSPEYMDRFQRFAMPHLGIVLMSIVMVLLDAAWRKKWTHYASIGCIAMFLPTWLLALLNWSGGGESAAPWMFFVGLASFLNTIISLPLIYSARRICQRSA